MQEWVVLELYRDGSVSAGKAAELLGISKPYFLNFLSQRNIPYLDWDADELTQCESKPTPLFPSPPAPAPIKGNPPSLALPPPWGEGGAPHP